MVLCGNSNCESRAVYFSNGAYCKRHYDRYYRKDSQRKIIKHYFDSWLVDWRYEKKRIRLNEYSKQKYNEDNSLSKQHARVYYGQEWVKDKQRKYHHIRNGSSCSIVTRLKAHQAKQALRKRRRALCRSEGCDRAISKTNSMFCRVHYDRITIGERWFNKKPNGRMCVVDGCDRSHHGKGYCRKHYEVKILPFSENGKKGIVRRSFKQGMSRSISKSLRGEKRSRSWESLVGYTLVELRSHLEALFTEGMSWDTYGVLGWHIDHIYPRSRFSFANAEDTQFKKCWALSNLQPLWWHDNVAKSDNVALV